MPRISSESAARSLPVAAIDRNPLLHFVGNGRGPRRVIRLRILLLHHLGQVRCAPRGIVSLLLVVLNGIHRYENTLPIGCVIESLRSFGTVGILPRIFFV